MEKENGAAELAKMYKEAAQKVDLGYFKEGKQALQDILGREPEHADALNKVGVIYAHEGDKKKATDYFNRSLGLNPQNPPALTNLGNIHLENGDMEKAESLYKEALRYDPDYGPAHNNMGAIYKKRGDYSKMVDSLKKARKAGTLSVRHSERSILLSPGCLVVLIIAAIFVFYLIFTR